MQLSVLHVDDAFHAQAEFLQRCRDAGATEIDLRDIAPRVRLWGFHADLDAIARQLAAQLKPTRSPRLTFVGSGDFHHLSVFLSGLALENEQGPVTLIHFDNHPDWVRFGKGIHCGSWINSALEHPKLQKIITIGVTSHDLERPEPKLANLDLFPQGRLELYPYDHPPSIVDKNYGDGPSFSQVGNELRWNTIRDIGDDNFLDRLIDRIDTDAVYLTIDKDVLAPSDAVTNWDQGRMQLPYLTALIEHIGRHKRIIGADVIGDYSRPAYAGGLKPLLSKYYESFKDHPRQTVDAGRRNSLNSAGNISLLRTLTEAMA